jgi:adenine phosphoribosyltransferase
MDNAKLRSLIRTVNDWPKPGVNFFDICSILEHPEAFAWTVNRMAVECGDFDASAIVSPDARGFLWGSPVAYATKLPLHLARKPGKLPGDVVTQTYDYEYASASISLQSHSALADKRVLLIDDVLATGGTALAIVDLLIQHFHLPPGNIRMATVINLDFLSGAHRLRERGVSVTSLLDYHE